MSQKKLVYVTPNKWCQYQLFLFRFSKKGSAEGKAAPVGIVLLELAE